MKDMESLHEKLDKVESKLDTIDFKLNNFLERLVLVEEKQRTDRGAISLMFATFMTFLGYLVYRLKIVL